MAEPGSWPSIREHGLMSTSALLTRYRVAEHDRLAIESQRRSTCVPISGAGLPNAVIRDQKPMSDGALQKCLQDGLLPIDWYRILNQRTFFWVSRRRLRRLLGAKAYRDRPQTVLTVETRSLVHSHLERIELSAINSGSTIFKPVPRGNRTFLPIAEYDYDSWRRKRGAEDAVVELIVREGVPDINEHVLAVHDWDGNAFNRIWHHEHWDPDVAP